MIGGYWWAILLTIAIVLFAGSRLYARPDVRLVVDRTLLRIPVLGAVLRDVAVARFTRTFGTLVSAGLPVLTALRITRGTLGNRAMEQVIDEVVEHVAAGRPIADHLEESRRFPPMLIQIIGLGDAGQESLSRAHVAIVGLGATGGAPASEQRKSASTKSAMWMWWAR